MPLKKRKFTVEDMAVKTERLVILIVLLLISSLRSFAQVHSVNDTIRLGAVVENGDTIPMVFLPDVIKIGQIDPKYAEQRRKFEELRYNVYKVYPYAVIAAGILRDVDANMAKLPDKRSRKAYLKGIEKQLNSRFKGELEDLTITQGQILVKLIDRQTGQNCFHIIKELKGGFNAFIWQSVALIFSNNLKREYDPYDRDKDIETIVQEIEAYNAHKYQLQAQQLRARAN